MKLLFSFVKRNQNKFIFFIFDFLIFLILFFNISQFFSLYNKILLISLFILINYIIGKYKTINSFGINILFRYLKKFTLSIIAYAFATTFYFYFFNYFQLVKFPFFSYYVNILYIFLTTYFSQLILNILIIKNKTISVWVYVGRKKIYQLINNQINIFRLNNIKILFYDEEIDIYTINTNNFKGFILDDKDKIKNKFLKKISKFNNQEISFINQLDWFERFFYKIPTFLISNINFEKRLIKQKYLLFIEANLKRLGDIFLSILLLIITLPILLISITAIKFEDGGPIFYRQLRNGINKKLFYILKLRTMNVSAEKDGAKWYVLGDTRVTKVGKILRLFRIDELPQLLQVINGDMSLIGPRPERPEFDDKLSEKIPFYDYRYTIKPGLSGWAQVNYPYGSSKKDSIEKLNYDIYYIKNFSIFLDFIILFKTIKLVLNAKGSKPKPKL